MFVIYGNINLKGCDYSSQNIQTSREWNNMSKVPKDKIDPGYYMEQRYSEGLKARKKQNQNDGKSA